MFEVYETFLKIVQTMWLISCDFDILQLIDLKAADLDFRSTYKVFGKDDWCVSKCYKEGCKQGYGVFPWWSPFMASIKKVNILISLIMRSSYESSFNGLKTAQAWPFSRVGSWRSIFNLLHPNHLQLCTLQIAWTRTWHHLLEGVQLEWFQFLSPCEFHYQCNK